MKCEEFISNLETGSAVTRLRARLHARHCPQCFAMQHRLSELRGALAAPENLTPFHRRVWERVAIDTAPTPARPWLTGPRLAMAGSLAVAAAVVVAIVLTVTGKDNSRDQKIARNPNPPPRIETQSQAIPPEDLTQLATGLEQVAASLERLVEEADLLEARSAISELESLYQPLNATDS